MKKRHFLILLCAALLFCLSLGGCGMIKNEEMDQRLEKLILALNEDDGEKVFQSMYPGAVSREDFDIGYSYIQNIWNPSDTYTVKMNSINVKKNVGSNASYLCQAEYYVLFEDSAYYVTLVYLSDSGGAGLYNINVSSTSNTILLSGSLLTPGENSIGQWLLLLLGILEWIFAVFTIVDIIRKRPRLFGLWILAALVFFYVGYTTNGSAFQFNLGVQIFILPGLKLYGGGLRQLIVTLPAGSIVYWCRRKKLIAKKAARMGVPPQNFPDA